MEIRHFVQFFVGLALAYANSAQAFVTGFNQAWLKNNYGHSFADGSFDEADAHRLLTANADAGAKVQRIWIFEGSLLDQIEFSSQGPERIRPDVLKNLRSYLALASQQGVQIYLTLFDGNVSAFANTIDIKNRYWNIFSNKYDYGRKFRENVLAPVLDLEKEFPGVFFGIDLANEINAFLYARGGPWFEKGWPGLNRFAKDWGDYIRSRSKIRVTVSLGWGASESVVLSGKLSDANLDFYDIHLYNNSGKIPTCKKLKELSETKHIPIYLGEYGQSSGSFNDNKQDRSTFAFLQNALDCGLSGAFAWRLSESLPSTVRGDHLSFESYGKFRPAYQTIKLFSALHAR